MPFTWVGAIAAPFMRVMMWPSSSVSIVNEPSYRPVMGIGWALEARASVRLTLSAVMNGSIRGWLRSLSAFSTCECVTVSSVGAGERQSENYAFAHRTFFRTPRLVIPSSLKSFELRLMATSPSTCVRVGLVVDGQDAHLLALPHMSWLKVGLLLLRPSHSRFP